MVRPPPPRPLKPVLVANRVCVRDAGANVSATHAPEQKRGALGASHRAFERLVGRSLAPSVVRVAVQGSACYMAQARESAAGPKPPADAGEVVLADVVAAAELLVEAERVALATMPPAGRALPSHMYAACHDAAVAAVREDAGNRLRELGMTSMAVWGMEGMAVAAVSTSRR